MLVSSSGNTHIFNWGDQPIHRIFQNEDHNIHLFVRNEASPTVLDEFDRITKFFVLLFRTLISCDPFFSGIFLKAQWNEWWYNREVVILFTNDNVETQEHCNWGALTEIRNQHLTMPQSYIPFDESGHNALPPELRELHLFYLRLRLENRYPSFNEFMNNENIYIESQNLATLPSSLNLLNNASFITIQNNSINALPASLGELRNLESLGLSYNLLQSLPDSFRDLQNLRFLYLQDNLFRNVPACIFELNANCIVNLQFNPLTEEAIRRVHAHNRSGNGCSINISAQAYEPIRHHVVLPCEQTLQEWCTDEASRKAILGNWSNQQKDNLSCWLERLKETADYKSKITQARLQQNIDELLKWLAIENDADEMAAVHEIIDGASTTCGDRVVLPINELTLRRKIIQSPNMDLQEMRALIIYKKRYEIYRDIAAQHCKRYRSGDPIEVYLHYETAFRIELNLEVQNMIFKSCSDVTEEDLKQARERILKETAEENHLEILCADKRWEKEIKLRGPNFKEIEAACEAAKNADSLSSKLDLSEEEGFIFKEKGRTIWNPVYQCTKALLASNRQEAEKR